MQHKKFLLGSYKHSLFAFRRAGSLREELNSLLGEDGVLLYPSHSTPAPYHGQALARTFNFAYTGIFNILGLPVTQVRNLVEILFLARFLLALARWESLLESRFTLIRNKCWLNNHCGTCRPCSITDCWRSSHGPGDSGPGKRG